jgi:hypothetical protein
LAPPVAAALLPATFANLQQQLSRYRKDPEVVCAAGLYEKAYAIFERLRAALRLSAGSARPLRDTYPLSAGEQGRLCQDLVALRSDAWRLGSSRPKTEEGRLYAVLSRHLEEYWDELGGEKAEVVAQRTTNELESRWGGGQAPLPAGNGARPSDTGVPGVAGGVHAGGQPGDPPLRGGGGWLARGPAGEVSPGG